ncbi:sensor histidine kinase [Nocardioides dongkuii]|uniref:sensor histidine kinase n=1 Tax=Nocardioides dongkuii TaxID=2760089 RepID=UPI0015F7CD01|nr:histidine kinase [Nocardioides dongkuii]
METLSGALRETPARFLVLAAAGSLSIVGSWQAMRWWDPFLTHRSILAEGWGSAAASGVLLLCAAGPLVALVRPLVAGGLVMTAMLVAVVGARHEWPIHVFVSLLVCAMVTAWRSRRAAWGLGIAALLPVASYAFLGTTIVLPYQTSVTAIGDRLLQLGAYAGVVALALGLALWLRRSALTARRTAGLEARAAEVEQQSAVVEERARLARDLHDVVAHHVSLIAVRAETAPYTVPDLSAAGRTLVAEIAEDSRRALEELRGVLGILRRSVEDPERVPQPTAADIATLVKRARTAGESVAWEPADLSGVSPPAGYVAFRVVQEALTNARRHAPGEPVRVETVPDATGGVVVRVGNATTDPGDAEGRGLTGMRERVEALGGVLAVRRDGGELAVEATVPGTAR